MDFVQFLRPDGRRREVQIKVDHGTEARAGELRLAGCRFETEILTTGEVHLSVEMDDDEGEIVMANEVVPNGPGIKEAVERLVASAHEYWMAAGCPESIRTRGGWKKQA